VTLRFAPARVAPALAITAAALILALAAAQPARAAEDFGPCDGVSQPGSANVVRYTFACSSFANAFQGSYTLEADRPISNATNPTGVTCQNGPPGSNKVTCKAASSLSGWTGQIATVDPQGGAACGTANHMTLHVSVPSGDPTLSMVGPCSLQVRIGPRFVTGGRTIGFRFTVVNGNNRVERSRIVVLGKSAVTNSKGRASLRVAVPQASTSAKSGTFESCQPTPGGYLGCALRVSAYAFGYSGATSSIIVNNRR
jgi:hypothetical protein